MSPRECAAAKARRLLVEGRVRLLSVFETTVEAEVRGDSALTYEVGRNEAGKWECTCEARGRCSHQIALMLVVSLKPGRTS